MNVKLAKQSKDLTEILDGEGGVKDTKYTTRGSGVSPSPKIDEIIASEATISKKKHKIKKEHHKKGGKQSTSPLLDWYGGVT